MVPLWFILGSEPCRVLLPLINLSPLLRLILYIHAIHLPDLRGRLASPSRHAGKSNIGPIQQQLSLP